MNAIDALARRDDAHRADLQRIGQAIGYGNAQSILGQLWDQMLDDVYGAGHGIRGRMGVTVDDKLPPLPKARKKRREQRPNGCYELVPAYTEAELKAYAHEAIAKALAEADAVHAAHPAT